MVAALELVDIHKSYGGNHVLRGVSLAIERGTVTGLIGANGAGKSTLVKIATGQVRRDGGQVLRAGEQLTLRDPADANRARVTVLPQELGSLFNMPVADAVVLGAEPEGSSAFYGPRSRHIAAGRALDRLGLQLPLHALVGSLTPSQQRLVSLAGALHRGAEVVFLDEPTAAMAADDAEIVLRTIRALSEQGVAVVFITHRFNEVLQVCDVVFAMRDGRELWVRDRSELSSSILVDAVTAGSEEALRPQSSHIGDDVVIEVKNASGNGFSNVSLHVRRGEIIGITGLLGCGVSEFVESLGGARQLSSGMVSIDGQPTRFRAPADALKRGVGMLVAERARSGFVGLPIRMNAAISTLNKVGRLGYVNSRMERRYVHSQMSRIGLDHRVDDPLATLSGGNRQKVLLSRPVIAGAHILILDDPTAGVDVGARVAIHDRLRELARNGTTIILTASEPEELLTVADRIAVMSRGRLIGTYDNNELDTASLTEIVTSGG